jgi:hypothetical protein
VRPFSTNELASMQATQEGAMLDTGRLLRRASTGTDEYGYDRTDYDIVLTSCCGLKTLTSKEVMDGTQVVAVDAQLRLPLALDGELSGLDRWQITHRFGVELATPLTFEFIGGPMRGPSGLVLNLRSVTDGSDT